MGHKVGEGLGKHSQGRAEIIEASKHKGRRGLGMEVHGFEAANVGWASDKEQVHFALSNLCFRMYIYYT